MKVKIKLFTVPGQVMHNSSRRVVLAGADGVVFVADARRRWTQANNESWVNMVENLRENGIDYREIPAVIQYNKMDLPEIIHDEQMLEIFDRGPERIFKAVATRGEGVLETLHAMLAMTWASLNEKYDFSEKFGITRAEFVDGIFEESGLGDVDPRIAEFDAERARRTIEGLRGGV